LHNRLGWRLVTQPTTPVSNGAPTRVLRPPSVAASSGPVTDGMRAAVLRAYDTPLELCTVPRPELREGEALLEVAAVGLCGTDLKLLSGALDGLNQLPVIPGHEVAGTVVEGGGPELDGKRAACYLYESCGECRLCRAGHPTVCRSAVRIGTERDGGLATYMAVKRENLLPFADSLSFEDAAVTMDAVTAPWSALHGHADVGEGTLVVIVGAGGLGLHGIQIARNAGARVAVLDPSPGRCARALEIGAEIALSPADELQVAEWVGEGADVVLESSGVRAGFDAGARLARPGGRIVCNGYKPGVEYGVDSRDLVLDELEIVGSRLGPRRFAIDALAAVERGEVEPQVSKLMPFDQVNEAFAELAAGVVDGRIVIQL
jgi:D-arabinose 1-dehydrogenase-like Zn-dependent alcohol dehydrogenase